MTRGAPMLLHLARALDRRRWRGGTALERVARKLGMLDRTARYSLGNGVTVDVPLALRPLDATDIREYETPLVQRLAAAIEVMRSPVTLFDCGADFGLITLKLVARCPAIARVVAVEPNAAMHSMLAANLARLSCVTDAVLAAVGDSIGRGELRYPEHDPGSDVSRFVMPTATGGVPITTVDALAGDAAGCVAIKCDVEGSELAVMRGARETIARAPHFVVAFEAHPQHAERTGVDPIAVVREIRSIRRCSAIVAETGRDLADDQAPLFEQVGERRIVNIVCQSAAG